MRQFFIQQVVTWVTVLALLVANIDAPVAVDHIESWFLVFVATWAVRMLLFFPLYRMPPSELAKRKLLRFFPLLTALLGNAFWIWTIPQFTLPGMVMQELILCAGFFCISIAMTGMWPVTPLTSLTYYVVLWGTLSFNLYQNSHKYWPAIIALNVLVVVMLFEYIQASIGQIQAQIRRGEELDAANSELQKLKDQALEELDQRWAYMQHVSHDLRQRLHAIRLWVSSAMDASKGGGASSYPLERVAHQVDDLEGFLSKILDYARWEATKQAVQPTWVSVHALFQHLELRFEHLAIEERTDLRVRHSSESILIDQGMLQRIMENLVENAVKYSRGAVLVVARRRAVGLCLDVIDNGMGIPLREQKRIFRPYYQHAANEAAGRGSGHGAGLGLAIVSRLSRQLGVRVEVKSVMGHGTRFRVVVPSSLI